MRLRLYGPLMVALVALLASGAAFATQPQPWEMGFQPPGSPVMEQIEAFHDLLLWIITLITLLVLGLILYVCVRFRAERNPTPSKRSHNTILEVFWTAVPVLILVVIAIPSFKLLYYMDVVGDSDMTIKAIGHQWYWSYEYPDNGNFTFDAFIVADEDLEEGQPRLLTTDNTIVVPVDTKVRILTTATDVLHSWAVPSLGVKLDAIPGRINETWIDIREPGMYYGQCSELCGDYHGFMPIMIKAVSQDDFDAWVKQAQEEFARVDDGGTEVAAGDAPQSDQVQQ